MLCLDYVSRMTPSPNSGHPGISSSPGSLAPGVSGGSPSLLSKTPQPSSGYHQHDAAESEEGKQVKPSALSIPIQGSSHAWWQRMDGTRASCTAENHLSPVVPMMEALHMGHASHER